MSLKLHCWHVCVVSSQSKKRKRTVWKQTNLTNCRTERTPKKEQQLRRWLTSVKRRKKPPSRGSCSTLLTEDSQVDTHTLTHTLFCPLSFSSLFFYLVSVIWPFCRPLQSFTLYGRMKRGQPLLPRRPLRSGTVAMTTGCWLASYSILSNEHTDPVKLSCVIDIFPSH